MNKKNTIKEKILAFLKEKGAEFKEIKNDFANKKYSKKDSDTVVMVKFCEAQKNKTYHKITMEDINNISPEKIKCFADMLRAGVPEAYVELPMKNAEYYNEPQIIQISRAGIDWIKGRSHDNTVFLCIQNPSISSWVMDDAVEDARHKIPSEEIKQYLKKEANIRQIDQGEKRDDRILYLNEHFKGYIQNTETQNDKLRIYLEKERDFILQTRARHSRRML